MVRRARPPMLTLRVPAMTGQAPVTSPCWRNAGIPLAGISFVLENLWPLACMRWRSGSGGAVHDHREQHHACEYGQRAADHDRFKAIMPAEQYAGDPDREQDRADDADNRLI